MAAFEIPLSPTPQSFSVSINNVVYQMTVRWIAVEVGFWALDISDANSNPIVQGIPLITGADLLAQYSYLNFGFEMIVQTDHDTDALPTFTNLGENSHLYAVFV